MIVGSTKFEKEFEDRIIRRHIYEKYDQYKDQMIQEMTSRHQDKRNTKLNVKECQGGLRDIEILLLVYKARYRLKEPVNRKLMKTICEVTTKFKEDLCTLNENFNFLKRLRDLYRLTVFAGNDLKIEYLDQSAKIMQYQDYDHETAVDKLMRDYNQCTEQTNQIVQRLVADLLS
jgi:UTP:GlnB (protein PII) uridylyltransferase